MPSKWGDMAERHRAKVSCSSGVRCRFPHDVLESLGQDPGDSHKANRKGRALCRGRYSNEERSPPYHNQDGVQVNTCFAKHTFDHSTASLEKPRTCKRPITRSILLRTVASCPKPSNTCRFSDSLALSHIEAEFSIAPLTFGGKLGVLF